MLSLRWLFRASLLGLLLLPACDSNDEDGDNSVLGLWQSRGDDVYYYAISENEIAFIDYYGDDFDNIDDCYVTETAPIVSLTDETITVQFVAEETETLDFDVRNGGEELVLSQTDPVTGVGFSVRLDRSDRQRNELVPECDFFSASSKHRPHESK